MAEIFQRLNTMWHVLPLTIRRRFNIQFLESKLYTVYRFFDNYIRKTKFGQYLLVYL